MMRKMLLMLLGGLMLIVMGGCEPALFPERLPRTQYERYDRLRGRYAPKERTDMYGVATPALRERLSPYRP
jgi:hypothetical protein